MILNKLCDGMEVHMSPDSLCSDGYERPLCVTPAASFFFPLANAWQLVSQWERLFVQLEQTLATSVPLLVS